MSVCYIVCVVESRQDAPHSINLRVVLVDFRDDKKERRKE